ncbi:MAG: endopeptidase La [Clostridia bacterium]|nr:endopeptidase La [Clostridia bacterium]
MRKLQTIHLPVIPLRDLMIFPNMVLHFDVGRRKSVVALEQGMSDRQKIFLVCQKDDSVEEPGWKDLCKVGTVAEIRQVMNLPGENIRVLVEGKSRGVVAEPLGDEPCLTANIRIYEDKIPRSAEAKALLRTCQDLFAEFARTSQRVSQETVDAIRGVEKAGEAADLLAANILTRQEERQEILNELDPLKRLEKMCAILMRETDMADTEKQIQARIRKQVEKNQKDYYLREQIKAIQNELGDRDDSETGELRKRMEETPLNEEARTRCEKELDRMSRMAPGSPEAAVSQTYIEWILDLPWGKETEDNLDLNRAREILNRDHYGMEEVKERIIEYLAVLRMKKDMKGPILCFVGPPGVGKTSIVKAIAEAVGRKFVQMSLGGVRDEAEIRGHRRTYIGSIPGRIISGIRQAGTVNPVFLFDEIDKMSGDFRGDPASAMLEVLDAEQNNAFRDHYLELPFDLSKVMFITTANSMETIPAPLLDRMELIEVPSYTEEEKLQILKLHLMPKQIREHGMRENALKVREDALKAMIEDYTREAGVRTLERTAAAVCRKAAVRMLDTGKHSMTVNLKTLRELLGAPRFLREAPEKEPRIGVVNGLAYTTVGGEMLEVECTLMPGKGTLKLTGQLGDVMKESAEAAFSWVRAHSEELKLDRDFYQQQDIHIHVPEGAVPKDGPSAGVTMATALVSALTGTPVRQDVAMTGEITLRGRVLPIGGLKEKTLAAYRAGIRTLIIPEENRKDLEKIPEYVLSKFRVVPVREIHEVLETALVGNGEGRTGEHHGNQNG